MNSWHLSDSVRCLEREECDNCPLLDENWRCTGTFEVSNDYVIGPKDHDLMTRLRNAGTDHRKFMRMITVYLDITAPLYW